MNKHVVKTIPFIDLAAQRARIGDNIDPPSSA
jgi:hypothetical protein